MRYRIAVAVFAAAAISGCGDDASVSIDQPKPAPTNTEGSSSEPSSSSTSSTSAPPAFTTSAPEGSPADIAVTEVVFGDHVTVTNLGAGSVSLDGLWLCNRPFYVPLPPRTLAPGETVATPADSLGDLTMLGGEVALYESDDFEDPEAMLDYVTWGRGGGRTRAAIEVGLWPEGDVVQPSGTGIESPNGGGSSADWASQ